MYSHSYSEVTDTNLRCNFDSDEVGKLILLLLLNIISNQLLLNTGVFNVTIIVTNEYGRSMVPSDLYRVSASNQLYNFETYASVFDLSYCSLYYGMISFHF